MQQQQEENCAPEAASIGKDPLTWSFVKLFAHQITRELGAFEGVPGSHAWKWVRDGIWRARLVTKAQVVGVLVSVHERNERVEFLIDDGTALVKAVRWSSSPWDKRVVLGDLVHVQGKLNTDKHWSDGTPPDREIRVMHISRVDDPNEELLHWLHVLELAQSVYSAAPATGAPSCSLLSRSADAAAAPRVRSSAWEQIAEDAFFALAVDASTRGRFVQRDRREAHDELLVQTLEDLLATQRERDRERAETTTSSHCTSQTDAQAVRVTFVETLARIAPPQALGPDATTRTETIRQLRKTFAVLRSSGLLFLEDPDADRHVLVSFEHALAPALLQQLRVKRASGLSLVELTEWVVTQRKFQRLPLAWLERSLRRLLASQHIVQHEASQRFHLT